MRLAPCGPPAVQGDGIARKSVVRVWVESWWAGEWVWVRGLAGVRGKLSWRSRGWPAGEDTVAMGAALRRSRQDTSAAMARELP